MAFKMGLWEGFFCFSMQFVFILYFYVLNCAVIFGCGMCVHWEWRTKYCQNCSFHTHFLSSFFSINLVSSPTEWRQLHQKEGFISSHKLCSAQIFLCNHKSYKQNTRQKYSHEVKYYNRFQALCWGWSITILNSRQKKPQQVKSTQRSILSLK